MEAIKEMIPPLNWEALMTSPDDRLLALARSVAQSARLGCAKNCSGTGCPLMCPPAIVPLLIYCYARGVCGSRDIVDLYYQDNRVRQLCGEKLIEPARLRCFRRYHRMLLQKCLADLLWAARYEKDQSQGQEKIERWLCAQEAEERIFLAIQMDSLD